MGYCSNVALAMYKKDFETMMHYFKENCRDAYDTWSGAELSFFEDDKDQVIVAKLYWMKWYAAFDEVIQTEEYLANLEETPYHFTRVGEFLEDNVDEDQGDMWEYCCIERVISSSYKPTKTVRYQEVYLEPGLANIEEFI